MTIAASEFSAPVESRATIDTRKSAPRFFQLISAYIASFEDRQQIRKMIMFDTYLLDDIGLKREDLCSALTLPYPQMPSDQLESIRKQRHADRMALLLN